MKIAMLLIGFIFFATSSQAEVKTYLHTVNQVLGGLLMKQELLQ